MWNDELGFDHNPFSVDKETNLVGYDDIIDEILYNAESGNILFIESPEGYGKTTLLKLVINKHKGQGKVVYINCNRLEDLNIENVIMKRYGFFKRLTSKTPKEMIVLIDNIDTLSKKNSERLKYFFDQNYIRSVVFAGTNYKSVYFTPSLKERISQVIKLPKLKNDDALEIIENRIGNSTLFTDGILKQIFEVSEKNPKKFLQNCEKISKYAAENYCIIVKQDHVKKVFDIKKVIKEEVKEPKEDLVQIKTKKETFKQKVEREIKEKKKDKPSKKVKKDTNIEINDVKVDPNLESAKKKDVAEEYY
jgi:Cdc6-like AAA superfamily ATPase